MRNFPDSMECIIQTAGKLLKRTKIKIQTSTRQKYYVIHYDTVKILSSERIYVSWVYTGKHQ